MKVVINSCCGSFGLSNKACDWLIKNKKWTVTSWENGTYKDQTAKLVDNRTRSKKSNILGKYSIVNGYTIEFRTNPDVIEVVETLGKKANGKYAFLKIIEIPDGVDFEIQEVAGNEWVAEKHRRLE